MKLRLNGLHYNFSNWVEFFSLYKDIFLYKEYDISDIKNNPVIIDCGSNIGMSILFFKKKYPKAKIVCFEPNPETFKYLKKNIHDNSIKNIKALNSAVCSKKGEIDFFIGTKKSKFLSIGDSMIKNDSYNNKKYKKIKVNCERLSTFIKSKVDILKIDIEGSEWQVLKEIEPKLKHIKNIILEYHGTINNPDNSLLNIMTLLETNGFKYKLRYTSGLHQLWKRNKIDIDKININSSLLIVEASR